MAFLRKYGTGTGADVYLPIVKRGAVDFAVSADWTPASGDVKVSKDGGAAANIGTPPSAISMGNGAIWKFVFSDAELQCKVLTVTVADSATKAVEDQCFIIETYGHASAMYQADLSAANLPANLKQIDGSATSGNNATLYLKKLDVQNSAGDAVYLRSTGGDGHGLYAEGNGAGDGAHLLGGATGHGLHSQGGSTSGSGFRTTAPTQGDGVTAIGGGTGYDVNADLQGAVSGAVGGLSSQAQTDMRSAMTAQGYTSARAPYLDNLNVGGNVASSAEVTAIQNNTRVVRVVPSLIERPDSGSTAFRIELYLYDDAGNMEAPDSAPTVAVVNQSGTSRDANLDSTTMALVSTGRYRCTYTVDTAHAIEELIFAFSVVEGGATRLYGNVAQVVDTTAVDFTSSDRTKLEAIHSAATEARLAELDSGNLPTDVANVYSRLGAPAGESVSADIAAAKTDLGTILNRLGAWTGSGLNTILGALRAIAGKASALTPTDLSTGTTYDNTTDSLEAIRDRGDSAWGSAGGEVTVSFSQVAAAIPNPLDGGTITFRRGDSGTLTLTGLGTIPSGRTKLWFTVKGNRDQADSESIIQLEESGGLLYLNGNVPGTANTEVAGLTSADGDLAVTNEATGIITITLSARARALLATHNGLVYDVQYLNSGNVTTPTDGKVRIVGDVTRAVS